MNANSGLAFMVITLVGKGFRVEASKLLRLGVDAGSTPSLKPHLIGKELTQTRRNGYVIDFFNRDEEAGPRSLAAECPPVP